MIKQNQSNGRNNERSNGATEEEREFDRKVEAMLKTAAGFLPKNATEARQMCQVCVRYGLDPLTGDLAISNRYNVPYITSKGMFRMALASGLFNGVEVSVEYADHEAGVYIVKAKVWKKGCEFPFEDLGDSHSTNSQIGTIGKIKIATTRAKLRALRSAFPVVLPVEGDGEEGDGEEMKQAYKLAISGGASGQPAAENERFNHMHQQQQEARNKTEVLQNTNQPSSQPLATGADPEWTRAKQSLGVLMREHNISGAHVRQTSSEMFGRDKSEELTAKELNSLVQILREEGNGSEQPPVIPPEVKQPQPPNH